MTPEETPTEATPAAVAHADALGVDLAQVAGSGTDGKIVKADVEAAAAALTTPEPEPAPEAPRARTAMDVLYEAKHRGRATVTKAELAVLRADGSLGSNVVEFDQAVIQNDIYVEDR